MARTLLWRLVRLGVVAVLAAVVAIWFRNRSEALDAQAPEWPPLTPAPPRTTDSAPTAPSSTPEPPPAPITEPTDGAAAPPPITEPTTEATTEPPPAPITEPTDGAAAPPREGAWIAPDADGSCPTSHPVKAKVRSGIYHVPGGASYERTNADRCYADPGDAESDGYRASKT